MKILKNESLAQYTTFKIGGKAALLLIPADASDLAAYLKKQPLDQSAVLLGKGSNVLISDTGVKTALLIDFAKISNSQTGQQLKVEAGVKLPQLAKYLLEHELAGLEFVGGIPGTVGGAVAMNVGWGDKWISACVDKIYCLDYFGKEIILKKDQAKFGYRQSIFQKEKLIITAVDFVFQVGQKDIIRQAMAKYKDERQATQPIEFPSAGSVFKNFPVRAASQLIDRAGCKGLSVGDAEVSQKHAGFIINKGQARAQDVLALIELVKAKVRDKFGVELELEIKTFL